MVRPTDLGAVSHFGVGTGSPVLPVARHGRLGRVHLILDVVGTVKGRIGGPVGDIKDVEVVGGDAKGILVQESCHLISLADATGIRSQDEARIGTGSWKRNRTLGRDVGADERSRRSKDGSGLSSSGRLPLPTIVGPSDGDDLSVFSRRDICLNLSESTESISGGQSHFESTPWARLTSVGVLWSMLPQSIERTDDVGGWDSEGLGEGASVGALVGLDVGLDEGTSVISTHVTPSPVNPVLQEHV